MRGLRLVAALSLLAATGCVAAKAVVAAADASVSTVKTGVGAAAGGVGAAVGGHEKDEGDHHGRAEPRPFDASRNADADLEAALQRARMNGTRVLAILGGNWCHDSRGLAGKFQNPVLASLIDARYELVWVDVGRRDRNLDIPRRYGVGDLIGTPTIMILSPDGALLNADSAHDWRNADSRSLEEVYAYLSAMAR